MFCLMHQLVNNNKLTETLNRTVWEPGLAWPLWLSNIQHAATTRWLNLTHGSDTVTCCSLAFFLAVSSSSSQSDTKLLSYLEPCCRHTVVIWGKMDQEAKAAEIHGAPIPWVKTAREKNRPWRISAFCLLACMCIWQLMYLLYLQQSDR